MLTSVFTKTVRDRAVVTLVAAGVLVAFALLAFPIYAGFQDQATELLDGMPEAFLLLVGASGGSVNLAISEIFGLVAPAVFIGFAITTGANLVAGEEADGTLGLLLANPVSRTRVLAAKFAVLAGSLATMAVLFWAGASLANQIGGAPSDVNMAAALLHLLAVALAFGGLASAVGAATGRARAGVAIAGVLAVSSYLATSLFPLIESLAPAARYTPFHLYNGGEPLLNGVTIGHVIGLGVMAALGFAASIVAFARRDLRG